MSSVAAAIPRFARGQVVEYWDHQGRMQRGAVKSIEAKWPAWATKRESAFVYYTVEHPSYHNRQMHVAEEHVRKVVEPEPAPIAASDFKFPEDL